MFQKIVSYFKESFVELKKVNWPTRKETVRLTVIVIIISLVVAFFLGFFDIFFSYILRSILL